MASDINLLNKSFGNLTVIERLPNRKSQRRWKCLCKCGATSEVSTGELNRGRTNSCGCSLVTHGKSKTPTWYSWCQMRQRCDNPNNKNYYHYGGRGIAYAPEWKSFEQFVADMGMAHKGMTLDRIDCDQGYSKNNCRWVTKQEQQRNKRTSRWFTYNGETKLLCDWEKLLGRSKGYLTKRLKRMTFIEAMTTPNRYNSLPEPPKEDE